jgi:hypothetical protein
MRAHRFAIPSLFGLALIASAGCSSSDSVDLADPSGRSSSEQQRGRAGSVHADAGTGAGAGGIVLPPNVSHGDAGVLLCGNAPCQCNNGVDDDGDGTVDGFDVECTGALDDDERTFATGIPGDNRDPKWQDCFFDGNSGAGDDRCRYPTECLTGELSQHDAACATTEACRNNCQPLVPNGCDCFGCCEVRLPTGQSVNITLSDSCSLDSIGDTEACQRCTPNAACGNECGECELCAGKTPADLPASCGGGEGNPPPADPEATPDVDPPSDPELDPPAPTPSCDNGAACADAGDCGSSAFCSMGCCIAVIR